MDETLSASINEVENQPVEIAFGDLVQFYDRDTLAPEHFVVVDPVSERSIGVCEILEDGTLAGDSSENRRAKVVGKWALEEIIRGRIAHAGYNSHDFRATLTRAYTAQSQKPGVLYSGRNEA